MNFIPSLNDFKSLLGNANDGNIVFTQDGQGLEKANHGNLISRKIHNYRQTPSNQADNVRIRQMLMDAISNSSEGKALAENQLDRIKDMLGIGDGRRSGDDLTRVELKLVLDTVELMVRGEDPGRGAGRIRASLKGIPSVDNNALVKGQIERLGHIGYPASKFQSVIDAARTQTQNVSQLFDEDILDHVFANGFNGHTKKEMVLFVRNSASHIQSQIFDKLFWKCIDLAEEHPNERKVLLDAGTADEVFLDVIREMTVSYAEGKDPRPATDFMLDRVPGAAEPPAQEQAGQPVDEQIRNFPFGGPDSPLAITSQQDVPPKAEKIAGKIGEAREMLTAKFNDFVKLLSSKQVGFGQRQLRNFVSQLSAAFNAEMRAFTANELVNRLCDIYKTTFNATAGTAEVKQEAANRAADEFADRITLGRPVMDMLNGISAKALTVGIGCPDAIGRFQRDFADKVADLPVGRGRSLDGATLASVAGQTFGKIAPVFDVGPLARAILMKLEIDPNDAEKCQKVAEALTNATGESGKMIQSLLAMQAKTALKDPTLKIDDVAAGFVAENKELVEIGKSSFGGKIDMKAVENARNDQFGKAAELSVPMMKPFVFGLIPALGDLDYRDGQIATNENLCKEYAQAIEKLEASLVQLEGEQPENEAEISKIRQQIAEKRKNLAESEAAVNDNKQARDSYDKGFVDKIKDSSFCGKLVLATQCGLLDEHPDVKAALVGRNGSVEITPENVDKAKAALDRLFAGRTLNEITTLVGYVRDGYSEADRTDSRIHPGANTFRKLYFDGQLDFSGVDPKPRAFLDKSIGLSIMNKGIGRAEDRETAGLSPKNFMTQEIYDAFYAEFRGALKPVIEADTIAAKRDTKGTLAAVGIGSEKAPTMMDGVVIRPFKEYSVNENVSTSLFNKVLGFGTDDPKVMRNALLRVGLTPKDLNSPEGWLKAYRLSVVIKLHGDRIDGAVEWAERVTGKSFDAIRFGDLFKLNKAYDLGRPIEDPQDTLKDDLSTIAKFLSGEATLAESKLAPADMPALLAGLRSLKDGAKSADLRLFGKSFSVSIAPNGSLTARLDVDGKRMPVAVARSLAELIAQIENQVVDHAKEYTADQLDKVLPGLPQGADPIARARELYSKTLSTLLGLPSVNFAHLSVKDLHSAVKTALNPPKNQEVNPPKNQKVDPLEKLRKDFSVSPKSYNSAETVELQAKYLLADKADRARVKVPTSVDVRTPDEKAHDFVAELVMNADTWAYDTGMKTKGARIAALIASGGPEIERLTTVKPGQPDLVSELPAFLQNGVREILTRLAEVAGEVAAMNEADRPAACAPIEDMVDAFVETSMVTLQADAKTLFDASQGDRRENWQKSLNEMSGIDGLSAATSQGRFTKKVLDNYFVDSDPIEKRSMLANVLRNTNKDSSRGKVVGEMLKGAGPLLQKTLQGLSANTFGPETQLALKDMKSKLLPISDSVIQANLLELVRSSNGEILSVEVKKSLGQATVGQALLCHIRTKSHPISGEDVVIKILRPNVQTAVQREYKTFLDIARKLDAEEHTGNSQQETFKGRYQTVLKEFDFTLESANIDLCMSVYDKPTAKFGESRTAARTELYDKVHSMDRHHAVSPLTGLVVLQKVEGKPVDRLLEDSRAEVDDIVRDIRVTTQLGEDVNTKATVYEAKSPADLLTAKSKLWNVRQDLINKHASLVKLVDIWMEKALFGDGVFHNDLHPGNVMISGTDVSVIDFGNVARLSKDQQMVLVYLFSAAMTGTVDDFVDGVKTLLGGQEIGKEAMAKLKTALADVFTKGSGMDVIPRMLAALSVLKDHSVPIPEVVHNFAESMSRIQDVIDGVVEEIEEIEEISDAMVFKSDDAAELKLDQTMFDKGEMPVFNGLFDGLNAIFKTLGVTENKMDYAAAKAACTTFYQTYGIGNGATRNEIKAEFARNVFSRDDGGVAQIQAIIDLVGKMPTVSYRNNIDSLEIKSSQEALERTFNNYKEALASGDKDRIANARSLLAGNFYSQIASVAYSISPQTFDEEEAKKADGQGPVIHDKATCGRFVECVGTTLEKRLWTLQLGLAKFKKIEEEKFVRVMEKAEDPNSTQAGLMLEIGFLDSLKFTSLKNIADKLSDGSVNRSKVEGYLSFFTTNLGVNDIKMPSREIKTMKRLAWDFRFPGTWNLPRSYTIMGGEKMANYYSRGKVDFDKHTVEEVRKVFQENLTALKKALKTEKPTKEQIEFFAQLAASTTRYLSFGDTFRQYDAAKLDEIAGASEELKTFLTAYKDAFRHIASIEG